jgi:hypothetical protein
METYYSIIQHCIKSNRVFFPSSNCVTMGRDFYNNVYEHEKTNISKNSFLTLTCYDAIYHAHVTCGTKISNLKKRTKVKFEILLGVLDNMFFSASQKEDFFTIFSKVQKTYKAIARFGRICKIRFSKVQNTEDLCMNSVTSADKNVLLIYQKGSNYLFTTRDLINIIDKSLTNNLDYFCDPLPIKNPYTNITFSYSILYNIYFFIKRSAMVMSQPLHMYFLCNFNLEKFSIDNECAIRDICIYNYVFNTPLPYLHDKIMYMVLTNIHTKKWSICAEFDKDKLSRIMLPYFYLSEISFYSLNPDKKYQAGYELSVKLNRFYNFNPLFGRKIFGAKPLAINCKCIDFYAKLAQPVVVEDDDSESISSDTGSDSD